MAMGVRAFAVVLGLMVGACSSPGGMSGDGGRPCVSDDECDDGVFCNGTESCDPTSPLRSAFGCVQGTPACDVRACDEITQTCADTCPDADGDRHEDVACGGDDCDDTDPDRFPGNPEVCDAEGHDEDCDPGTFGGRDVDGDGAVDARCCNGDACGGDCVDTQATVHPDATETCDGTDQDCDGAVDEGLVQVAFRDEDGDLHGDPEGMVLSCPGRARTSTSEADCDDANPRSHGLLLEVCDGADNDCDGTVDEETVVVAWYPDGDGDGFGDPAAEPVFACEPPEGHVLLPTDCDDSDPARHPAAAELCNGRDDDCDGFAGFEIAPGDHEDDDRDGVPDAACGGTDCDDRDPLAGGETPELCDDVDNDCDGTTDEDVAADLRWFVDADGDGFGGAAGTPIGCERPAGSFVLRGGDCQDDDDAIHPAQVERCDGVDNDCDGSVDEDIAANVIYDDADGDGFGDASTARTGCGAGAGEAEQPGDCDDGDPLRFPGATELCDDVDQDCDGTVDEGAVPLDWYPDADGDGYGDPGTAPIASCTAIGGRAPNALDCDDGRGDVSPDGTETCDGADEDCDGTIDEGPATTYYRDADGDTVGTDTDTQLSCGAAPTGYVATPGDCDDSDPLRSPLRVERCDGLDEDCDGSVDEGSSVSECSATGHTGSCASGGGCECSAGLGDCNGTSLDGCETDVTTTRTHCGACGAACLQAQACASSACATDPIVQIAASAQNLCFRRMLGGVACSGPDHNDIYLDRDRLDSSVMRTLDLQAEFFAGHQQDTVPNEHRCALQSGGTVIRCWGVNSSGGLGDGTMTTPPEGSSVVAMTPSGATYSKVLTGSLFTCALRTTGGVDCWGEGSAGRLGTGDTSDALVPTPVVGISDAIDLDVGGNCGCVVHADGRVSCWGEPTSGRTGDRGPSPDNTVPTALVDVAGAVAVSMGTSHGCAVLGDGRVRCWGDDRNGELGDGTIAVPSSRTYAADVVGITTAVEVAASTGHSCARLMDDRVVCWGLNHVGQVGDGSTTNRPTPQIVVDPGTGLALRAIAIGGAEAYSCAATTDGLMCWGVDRFGRLGTNNVSSLTPQPVPDT